MFEAKGILIDANNLLYRTYHVLSHRNDNVNEGLIVFSFMNQVRNILTKMDTLNPLPFIIWDGPDSRKMRQEIYSTYKGNRKKTPELINNTRTALIEELGKISPRLAVFRDGVEADDLIAIMSAMFSHIKKWVVCSRDADMMQLINKDVTFYNPHTKETWCVDDFMSKYGFDPFLFGIYKGIVGDASDNWPGVPGIGDKTAKKLIGNDFKEMGIAPAQERIVKALNTDAKRKAFKTGMRICDLPFRGVQAMVNDYLEGLFMDNDKGPWDEFFDRFGIQETGKVKIRVGNI